MIDSAAKGKRKYYLLILASFLLYIILTGTKNLYTAEKLTLLADGSFGGLSDLALCTEYYYVTYGIGQIVLAFVIKRINIRRFLFVTLMLSALLFLSLSFSTVIMHHYIIFALSGLLQAGVWGGLISTLTFTLPKELQSLASGVMTSGPAIASAMSWAVAAAFGEDWRLPFLLLSILLAAILTVWFVLLGGAERETERAQAATALREGKPWDRRRVVFFYLVSAVISFSFTSFFFIVSNTLDIYLADMSDFSPSSIKMLVFFAPLVAVLGPWLTIYLSDKLKNFMVASALTLLPGILLLGVSLFTFQSAVTATYVMLVGVVLFVNGARSVMLSIAAMKLRDKLDARVFSVTVNAIGSFAAGISPRIATVVLDRSSSVSGWTTVLTALIVWTTVTLVIVFLTAIWLCGIEKREQEPIT